PGADPDPGPDPVEPSFVADLAMVANSWGDVMLSWSHDGADPAAHVYAVEILDVSGASVVRTITLAHPVAESGQVLCAYPVEQDVPDFAFPPTFLAWRVRVDGAAEALGMAGAVAVDDAAFVVRAVAFAGQSNALAHFTTLSGIDGRRDLVSAGYFRRDLAARLGLRDIEVIPVQAAWGSSAADKHADDDPVSGVNYWWDLDAGTPGPRMTEFLAIVGASGAPVTDVIW
ncbi:hypothetical protein V5F77_28950, partial [Xanthobacter sp. DSM 24535]|uniref:hypothetical protein n=1 Tax=Roseixanthobacter psychrophilus TaxID=3119917 RepID=UPI0037286BEA